MNQADEIRIGISACLLGDEVRYDGGHKRDRFLTDTVSRFVHYVSVCPEVEIGLGIPRETIRLVRSGDRIRLLGGKSGDDHTGSMNTWARAHCKRLAEADLSGYILKRGSPSCGMERVKVYGSGGMPTKSGRGLFAEQLMKRLPLLPVEEEGRLCDPRLRENFFERVFAYRRLTELFSGRWRLGELVAFHSAEKLLLMAHDQALYRQLGRMVAQAKGAPRRQLAGEYQTLFMTALKKQATTRKHFNVLQHVAGYFKRLLDDDDRRELHAVLEDYRQGLIPLVVPVTLLRHHVRRHQLSYLQGQTYLEPHPKELMLRNHS
jgi:uncharacterized protein YbgA (DUF1722 family)/uncharacterized protein YbbK (DUF523 family)